MRKSITQDMAYRQSLMKYAEKYGVSRASRKYNKSRSYIYFWKARWDGSVHSLACQSRRPHSHPKQHTEAELKLIRDMRRRNPNLGMVELWHRLRKRGYTRRPESLFRVMRKLELFPPAGKKETYKPKPYEQMTYPGQRVQVDVKVVPRKCITDPELRLYQYTAIDEFTRLRFLAAYPEQSTYSSADFLEKLFKWYARRGFRVECVQTDNGFEFTNRFSNSKRDLPTLFEAAAAKLGIRHKLIRPYTPRHNGKVERSHREDQKRFYSCHSFYSLDDFTKQLAVHNRRSNNFPMRPLGWLSPAEFTVQFRRLNGGGLRWLGEYGMLNTVLFRRDFKEKEEFCVNESADPADGGGHFAVPAAQPDLQPFGSSGSVGFFGAGYVVWQRRAAENSLQ